MAKPKKHGKVIAHKPDRVSPESSFRVAARTLLHLGRELITSDEIAINELIKNSFDAGSPTVGVRLICPVETSLLAVLTQKVRSGEGPFAGRLAAVTEQLAAAATRQLGEIAQHHLQSVLQRLAHATTPDQATSILEEVNFVEVADTGCGIAQSNILPVFLTVGTDFKVTTAPPEGVNAYLGNKGIGRLAMMRLGDRAHVETWVAGQIKASSVDFDWRLFDDAKQQLGDIPIHVALVPRPQTSISGTIVRVYALRSDWTQERVENDGLQSFIRRLRNPFSKRRSFRIRVSVNDQAGVAFPPLPSEVTSMADQHLVLDFYPQKATDATDEILTVTLKLNADDESADKQTRSAGVVCKKFDVGLSQLKAIGPFRLNIMRFNRRMLRSKSKQDWPIVRPELDIWSGGIAIYRDGFRVGFTGSERDGDWLGLDHKALRGGGYIVNRIQVIGALEISHGANANLIDLTNREGLVTTSEAELLKEILLEFAIGPLRSLVEAHDEELKQKALEKLVNEGTSTLNDRLALAKRDLSVLKADIPKSLRSSVTSLDEHLHFISTQVTKFETAIEKASEGREDILELAGIGNVMHGVMHELTRTTAQTRKLMLELAHGADVETQELLNKLEGEIRAINTRLRQLDPLMPGGRHVKRDIDVGKLAKTILNGYTSRLQRHKIDAFVNGVADGESVKVRMVPGFLSLALENLISNSVYWVGQREPGEVRGRIDIEIDGKASVVTVTDNGPGVSASDRERVFLPGFSLRVKGKGYGLYLAREVAEYHGGRLFLDPHSDVDGQLHTFVLELPRSN